MSELDDYRIKINKIDDEMSKLFVERMEVSKNIADYKLKHALPIYDENREKEVVEKNSRKIEDSTIREYYINFLKNNMDLSKQYQQRVLTGIKVAYSGVEGAFAHIAATKMFPNATYISYGDFGKAYKSVEKGECDVCVLPLENSFNGDVGVVTDLIFSGSLYVNQVFELEVVHNLLAKKGVTKNDIKTVISHPQALAQCGEYLSNNNIKTMEAQNTALAAKLVSDGNDLTLGAIASIDTAKLYNLQVLETNINSSHNNTTRFGAFSRCQNNTVKTSKMGEHFFLVFAVKNEAGALAETLNIIGKYGFNMRSLRSRPMKELIWSYYFFAELEGDINSEKGKQLLIDLSEHCDKLKVAGSYHYDEKK